MKKNQRELKENGKKPAGSWLTLDFAVELLLLVIVFLIPVIFDRRVGIVFSGTKIAFLRAFVIIILSLWAGKLLISGRARFVRTPLDWPVAAYLLTTTVATLTAVHTYVSFAGFYGRFEGLSTWYLFGLLFFITTNYIYSFEQLKRIVVAVVSAATLMSVYGVINRQGWDPYMWGGVPTKERVIGTIGQPNFLAAYILMAFFLALILFLEEKHRPEPINWLEQLAPLGYFLLSQGAFVLMIYTLDVGDTVIWYASFALITGAALMFCFTYDKLHPLVLKCLLGVCIILIYVCLLYTQSRGGYMGLFTGAVLFALVVGRHWLFKHWKELALIGLLIVAVSAITMMAPEYSPFARFTSEISVKSDTKSTEDTGNSQLDLKGAAGSRGETWKSGYRILADNPLFGIGPEDLKMVFPRYETNLFRFKETFHVKQDRNHNETLDVSVTKGLITFFLYLWVLAVMFKVGLDRARSGNQAERLMAGGLLAAGLAYLVQNQFSFGVVAITSLFWTIWGMIMVLGREAELTPPKAEKISLNDIPWLPLAGVAVAAIFLLHVSFASFFGDIYFKMGKNALDNRQFPQAADNLKHSLEVFPLEGTTVSHLAISYLNQGNLPEAAKYLIYGNQIDPFNADNFYMLARVNLSYFDQGNKAALAEAIRYTEIALKIDPYYAEAYENRGMIAERLGKPDVALGQYEKAFEVNPNLVNVINRLTDLSLQLGRKEEARQLLTGMFQRYPENLDIFKALERLK